MKSKTLARQEEREEQTKAIAAQQEQQEQQQQEQQQEQQQQTFYVNWGDYPGYQIAPQSPPPYDPPVYPSNNASTSHKSNDNGAIVLFWLTILLLIGVLLPVLAIIWDEGLIEIGGPVYACLPMGFALTTIFAVSLVTIALTSATIWLLSAAAGVVVTLNYLAFWILLAALTAYFLAVNLICAFLASLAILLFITVFFFSRKKERFLFSCYIQQASRAILCHPKILVCSAISGLLKLGLVFLLNFLAFQLTRLSTEVCFKAALIGFVACASLWIAAIISGVSQARLACLFRSTFCGDCSNNCCSGDKFGSIIYAALVAPAFNLLYWVTDDVKPCATINVLEFVLDSVGSLIFRCAQLGSHYLFIFIGMNGDNFQEASTVLITLYILFLFILRLLWNCSNNVVLCFTLMHCSSISPPLSSTCGTP